MTPTSPEHSLLPAAPPQEGLQPLPPPAVPPPQGLRPLPPPQGPRPVLPEDGHGARMSFVDHLMELRRRLLSALLAVGATTILALVFYQPVFGFLRAPVDALNERYRTEPELIQRLKEAKISLGGGDIVPITSVDPLATFFILMKVAFIVGLVLSSPIVVYELWAFLSPGLRHHERKAIRPILSGGILFFLAGCAFCYYLVFPFTLDFLVWFDLTLQVRPDWAVSNYVNLLIIFMLLFGLIFEMPLVIAVLAMLRVVSPALLTRHWRYISLACFVLGAVLSPGGDPFSMLLMSGSMVVLYALSIGFAKLVYPKAEAPGSG